MAYRMLAPRKRQRLSTLVRGGISAAVAARNAWTRARTMTRTMDKKNVQTGVVTNQYDVKTTYRKKRMPRYKKRRWLSFKKKVLYANNAQGAKQVYVNRRVISPTVNANVQSVTSAALFMDGNSNVSLPNSDIGYTDMQDIWDAWINTASGQDNVRPGKLNFTSAVLDIEIGNIGGEGLDNSLTVDVYHCKVKRRPDEAATVVRGLSELMAQALANVPNMSSANTVALADQAGVTPFCAPGFSKYVEIKSAKKVILSVGQNAHFQLRLSRDKIWFHSDRAAGTTGLLGGWTEGYLFIVQGVTTASQFSAPCRYVLNATRTYHFRVMDAHLNYGGIATTPS